MILVCNCILYWILQYLFLTLFYPQILHIWWTSKVQIFAKFIILPSASPPNVNFLSLGVSIQPWTRLKLSRCQQSIFLNQGQDFCRDSWFNGLYRNMFYINVQMSRNQNITKRTEGQEVKWFGDHEIKLFCQFSWDRNFW
jgi:hypothetical protein